MFRPAGPKKTKPIKANSMLRHRPMRREKETKRLQLLPVSRKKWFYLALTVVKIDFKNKNNMFTAGVAHVNIKAVTSNQLYSRSGIEKAI
jgi:hypothetical protein